MMSWGSHPGVSSVFLAVLLTFTVSPVCAVANGGGQTDHPNVVFMVVDDLGWNDVGYNNPDIISPNINRLASEGLRLTQSYVQPLCSPSRSAFMTGFYPYTMGLQHLVILSQQPVCLPADKTTLAEVFKANGYKTHMIGKWHLGHCKWECTPTYRGFDSFYGFYCGAEDHYTKTHSDGFDFRFNKSVEWAAAGPHSTDLYNGRAVEIIQYHPANQPLFLYLPFHSVHTPLEVHQKYKEMYPNIKADSRKTLSGMVTALDDAIGDIVQALKDKGIYNNTLIVFSSDNGGDVDAGANNSPLRGGKATLFEGGTRVPAFVHGSMLQKKGVNFDGIMHAVDWFPTFVEAANLDFAVPSHQDGVSQWQAFNTLDTTTRTEFVYNIDDHSQPLAGKAAIRVGDYKLIEGLPGLYQDWYLPDPEPPRVPIMDIQELVMMIIEPNVTMDDVKEEAGLDPNQSNNYLFNLKDDPEERTNLYDQLPEKVEELRARLEQYRARYMAPNFPQPDPSAAPDNFGGAWTPGWC